MKKRAAMMEAWAQFVSVPTRAKVVQLEGGSAAGSAMFNGDESAGACRTIR